MKSVFITGTDTGVGKTVLAAALLAAARARGIDATCMKPVQTGCSAKRGRLIAPDIQFCLDVAGFRPSEEELEWMSPCRFKPACSPHLAAEMSGNAISIDKIRLAFSRLASLREAVVVEGAGGVLVPLDRRLTMLDLMKALSLPVVVAARPGLGTINHTLLSVRELRRAGVAVAGVVIVHSTPARPGPIERDNVRTVAEMGGVDVLGELPFCPSLGSDLRDAAPRALERVLSALGA